MNGFQVLNWPEMFPPGSDPEAILQDPANRRTIHYAIQLFFMQPAVYKKDITGKTPALLQNFYNTKRGQEVQNFDRSRSKMYTLQNYATSSAFQEEFYKLSDQYREVAKLYDQNYELIYKNIPLSGSATWTIRTIKGDIGYKVIREGGSIVYGGYSDAKQTAEVLFYGAGVGITRQAILTREFVQIEELLSYLRDAAFRKMGEVLYGLIESVSGAQNILWQTTPVAATDPSYTAKRDIATLNAAAKKIIDDTKTKGYGDPLQARYIVLHDHGLTQRMKEALAIRLQPYSGSTLSASYDFFSVPTTMLTDTSKYYVILPGHKIQKAMLLAPTRYQEFNQTQFLERFADWMAFGGVIGDEQQITRCDTA